MCSIVCTLVTTMEGNAVGRKSLLRYRKITVHVADRLVEHRRHQIRLAHIFALFSYFAARSMRTSYPGVNRLWGTNFPIYFLFLSYILFINFLIFMSFLIRWRGASGCLCRLSTFRTGGRVILRHWLLASSYAVICNPGGDDEAGIARGPKLHRPLSPIEWGFIAAFGIRSQLCHVQYCMSKVLTVLSRDLIYMP